jgi:hypothetical protein
MSKQISNLNYKKEEILTLLYSFLIDVGLFDDKCWL